MLRPVSFSLSFSGESAAEYPKNLNGKTIQLNTSGSNRKLFPYLYPTIHIRPGQKQKVTEAEGRAGHYGKIKFVPLQPCSGQKPGAAMSGLAADFVVVG